MLAVWQEVLKRDDISVTDNFFELGGDSIRSLRVIALARKAGLRLRPKQMLEHPTIASAARVAQSGAAPALLTVPTGEQRSGEQR